MPDTSKKKALKQANGPDSVQMIADGSNKVLLVFPKGSTVKGQKTLSAARVSKMLGTRRVGEVEGQCSATCAIWCDPFRSINR